MTRWRPVRAGITNVWRYYDEVFTFEQGRLLLRGPNGSGKSKALEVLLPFLLDASTQPSRLSTFGTTSRTMHWNLMGEGATGRTRVGFVWLELEHDKGQRVSIGARLQASEATTRVDPTYFLTEARIGDDIQLTDAYDAPLTVAALKQALEGNGRVFARPADYRAAVRERLFPDMSPDRYNTLVQALLQLRRPKLSEHLDPEALSGLLSSALPPVDELQIAELAEGFERLDQQRAQLATLERQERATRDLVTAVGRYARTEIRRHATTLTQATTALDGASATVRKGEDDLARQREAAAAARAAADELATRCAELAGAKDVLERSDDYQQGRNLDDLRQRVTDARTGADRTAEDARRADERATASQSEVDADLETMRGRHRALAEVLGAAAATAVAEGLIAPGDLAMAAPPTPEPGLPDAAEESAEQAWAVRLTAELDDLDARSRSRLDELRHLRTLLDDHDRAVRERERCEAQVARAGELLDQARLALAQAVARVEQALTDHETAVLAWTKGATALALDRAAVEAALDSLRAAATGVSGDGAVADTEAVTDTVAALAGAALSRVQRETGLASGELTARRTTIQSERDATADEHARLSAATTAEPVRAGWRDRPSGAGVPLWRLVDAVPGVPDETLAGVEAALEASGLLDAWVLPDGAVRLDGHDVVLSSDSDDHSGEQERHGSERAEQASLAAILRPDTTDQTVPASVVAGILDSIALYDPELPAPAAELWVATDGRWRFGVQHGRWSKPAAQFVGAEARERHRLERLAALAARLTELDAQLEDIRAELTALDAFARQARDEARGQPSETALRAAASRVTSAESAEQTREQDHAAAVAARGDAEGAVRARWLSVEATAARSRLPVQSDELRDLEAGLTGLLRDTSDLRRDVAGYLDAWRGMLRDARRAVADAEQAEGLRQRANEDETGARRLEAELAELDATMGAAFRDVVQRIAALEAQLVEQDAARKRQEESFARADKSAAELAVRLESAETAYRTAAADRDAALEAFGWVMGTLLADDLDLDEPVSVDADRVRPTLDLARQLLRTVRAERAGLPELNSRMTEQIRQAEGVLADRALLELNIDRDAIVPSAIHGGRRTSIRRLLDAVTAERVRTRDEITEHELALFRRILTGDTRRHLSGRIRDAVELVDSMNRRLASVRTSSDVRVRLVWEVRRDDGNLLAQARDLLLTTPDRLSEADETALIQFLDERIRRAREADDGLPWSQQLAKVFDYTDWHRFRVQMARGEAAEWKPLTKQVHSALSGGEKAIALHLPLFAALAAHYEATPGSPRLILLDEVFVGIDTANRGQIFGLLTDLDFDLLLTSDHEWAAYPQVPGMAIHALASDPDDEAVTSTRFVWTGRELVEDPMDAGLLL